MKAISSKSFRSRKDVPLSTVTQTFEYTYINKEKIKLTFTSCSCEQASLKPACGVNRKVIFLNVNAKPIASGQ